MDDKDYLERLRIDRSTEDRESPWPRRLLLLGIAVVLVGVAASWFFSGVGTPEVDAATVAEAQAGGPPASVLDASGYVVARRKATVSSKVTGRLAEVNLEEGMSVSDGQVLARLDDANASRALQLAQAREQAAQSALREI